MQSGCRRWTPPELPITLASDLEDPAEAELAAVERGTAIGRLLVLGTLGMGGMGMVLSAHDPQLDRKVALKLLRGDVYRGDEKISAARQALVLEQLGRGDASITELAEKFDMTLTGMKKHVGVLEQARLVTTQKVGRVRTCRLGPRRLEDVTAWLERYRQLWDARFDELEKVVEELKRKEKIDGRENRR